MTGNHEPVRHAGYAGRKDRFAVARQWFSVPRLDPGRALALEGEGIRVLEAVRHPLVPFFFNGLQEGQYQRNDRRWPPDHVADEGASESSSDDPDA